MAEEYLGIKDAAKYLNANFPEFYNSMSKKPTITAFFEV
jgi:hypothetical protein